MLLNDDTQIHEKNNKKNNTKHTPRLNVYLYGIDFCYYTHK